MGRELALPIIRSAVLDSDPRVAERARTLLTDYYQLADPKVTFTKVPSRVRVVYDSARECARMHSLGRLE